MLSKEENDLLCRVSAGTPMGNLMRQYWVPAVSSAELPGGDSPPVRVKLLGEELLAFRVSSGAVGLVDHNCPHRGTSLFYGRNEEEGLRCVYHGWKFDVSGQCVDMPNEPPNSTFKDKVKVPSYPCVERNGMVWTYMGPRETPPPLPDLVANQSPDCLVRGFLTEANWTQVLEGVIDTAHANFLHAGHLKKEDFEPGTEAYHMLYQKWAHFEVRDHDVGTSYAAVRPAGDGIENWRMGHFMFPFYAIAAPGLLGISGGVGAQVPMDDYHTMSWSFSIPGTQTAGVATTTTQRGIGGLRAGTVSGSQMARNNSTQAQFRPLQYTSDWYGRYRSVRNARNDYEIDREKQRTMGSFSGMTFAEEDPMAQESMGPLYDRRKERLGSSDAMVIRTRRKLMAAAQALQNGITPPGVDQPRAYRMQGGGALLPAGVNGLDDLADLHHCRITLEEYLANVPAGLPVRANI